jgi:hypothetical protein
MKAYEMGGHALRMRETRVRTIFCLKKQEGRENLEDLGVDGNIILEGILMK